MAKSRGVRLIAAASLAVALAACGVAPGMQMQRDIKNRAVTESTTDDGGAPQVSLTEINAAVIAAQTDLENGSFEANLRDLASNPSAYLVGPADVLQITVWDHPELAQAQGSVPAATPRAADAPQGTIVDEDGFIQFPYAGYIKVAGLGTAAIQARVEKALSQYFKSPQVTVRIASFRSKQILIDGEVHTPGSLQINDVPMTLTDAIGRAGGFTSSADQGRLVLIRGRRSYTLDLTAMLANGLNPSDIILVRGDVLRVMSRDESSVYVMGEVSKPVAAIPKPNGRLTLADALSQAGSFSPSTSDPRHLYVVRNLKSSQPEVFHLDARSPVSMMLASKFPLQPNDVVYVDANDLVRVSRVLSLLLPAIDASLTAAVVAK
ncbi:polysaccharide biosynthesis/export family protein [Paraburkholderia nemoris]|uniref:polysaccharide biosynthesis/export family protein n=1 Tax=Paraburkholderia nemoris TaxID=2793076 RepID=UPI0038BC7CC0